jgi:peptide-methionine (R)-S-oxide reductase
MMMKRRTLMISLAAAATGAAAFAAFRPGRKAETAAADAFEFTLSDAEWRKRLSEDAYAVLRHEATERPYTSALLNEKRAGIYTCAGCDLDLYASKTKFDSGTGWPSFYEALPNAVGTKTDYKLLVARTEVHCRRCGGHLGHVFDDGPPPTGKRHCINGVALGFRPETA